MSTEGIELSHAEQVLLNHLTTVKSLDYLALEGFLNEEPLRIIPTELIRDITEWALKYYFKNGREVAPSKEAIMETWADELEKKEILVDDDVETDSIQWSVEQLRAQYATYRSQKFVRDFATAVFSAGPDGKVEAFQTGAHDLYQIAQALVSRHREQDAADGFRDALDRYEARKNEGKTTYGMTFGLPMIDEHIHGVHPGELAVLAAGSGVGKSWLGGTTTLNEWSAGRLAVLFTLENDLDMTFDRLACLKAKVKYDLWQRAELDQSDVERVEIWAEKLKKSDNRPIVLMPDRGNRTVSAIVRKAVVLGGESLIIDQLSFVEHNPNSKERQRWAMWGETIHDLKNEISEGTTKLPCLLLHQINREGMRAAAKTGQHEMDHLAEAAEIERTADFVFALYQSRDAKIIGEAVWQTLKSRRVPPKDWDLAFRLDAGDIRVRGERAKEAA
jgi:replicative DNA helicase